MPVNTDEYLRIRNMLTSMDVTLVAVSKTKPASDIEAMYALGQRDFGENYVQELVEKQAILPADIRWHFIGHLQRNKVKYIAPFVHLIHGVDSLKLLQTIDRQGAILGRKIGCLLQMHIASEETKFGLDHHELTDLLSDTGGGRGLAHASIQGLMGMASFSDDKELVRHEFRALKSTFDTVKTDFFNDDPSFATLSMGMSGDHAIAMEEGSNMVRIGSLLFGARG
jgi:pyridoxal phosphate enzyme (YggS family)